LSQRDEIFKELEHEIQFYSEHTKQQYRAHLSDFLDWLKARDWHDREVIYGYIAFLKKKGFSQSHINYLIRGPVGILFRMENPPLRLPVKLPKVDPAVYDETREELFWTVDQVEKIIQAARVSSTDTAAIIAVATVYAPRMTEILGITKKSLDFNKSLITIHTEKHNLIRRHLIPHQIFAVLAKSDWAPKREVDLRNILDAVVTKAGIERLPRQSYHAFRHALWDELDDLGFKDEEIYKFTGWKRGGTLGSYAHPLKHDGENDIKIFEKHPFLHFWE
jgi:hypothetical protein